MKDFYHTIERDQQCEIKVKGSRFIGETCAVTDPQAAAERLTAIRKREHAATHHCWAYRIGTAPPFEFKYSDDGEPTGTAGRPIHDVLEGADLTNVILIVTRYFGGTKLGTGGLARAYSDSASAVLKQSNIIRRFLTDRFTLTMSFPVYNQVRRMLAALEVSIVDSEFTDIVRLVVDIRQSRTEQLTNSFVELTQGKGGCERTG